MRKLLGSAALAALLAVSALGPAQAGVTAEAVVKTYADIAQTKYGDSLTTAKALQDAIYAFLAKATAETLAAGLTLALANGGVLTHPNTGRPCWRPCNLAS